jgi:hypothetical protein
MQAIIKKVAVVLIAVLCMTYISGCQINKVDVEPEKPTKPGEEVIIPDETPTENNTLLKELAIHYQGNNLQISEVVNDKIIEDLFGKVQEKSTHVYTAADNMDPHIGKTTNEYKFSGMLIKTINTLEEEDKFYVYKIEFTDPMYATPRNIKVGDSLDMLIKEYPELNVVPDSDYYLYNPIDHFDAMGFTIKDRKISHIQIYTLLE